MNQAGEINELTQSRVSDDPPRRTMTGPVLLAGAPGRRREACGTGILPVSALTGWKPVPHGLKTVVRGFTLIELIVSISVGVVISGIAGSLIWNASRQRTEIAARSELVDAGASALEVMIRYLREIPQDECPANPTPCLDGKAQVLLASATELRFGATGFRHSAGAGRVEISNDNGATWHALAGDVSGFAFSYFNRTGVALASFPLSQSDRAAVRRISVDIRFARGAESARLRTSVYLRNFMNEVTTDVGP